MISPQDKTQAFIVRIWCEPREIKHAPPEWRGMIEHVQSGQRRYFKSLTEMAAFIVPYLETMGVKPKLCWRLRQWLKRWTSQAKMSN